MINRTRTASVILVAALLAPALPSLAEAQSAQAYFEFLMARRLEANGDAAGALAAGDKAEAGDDTVETRRGYMPFFYGRWDAAARAHVDAGVSERSRPVRDGFAAAGAFNPAATREEAGRLAAPVLVYAGELDTSPAPGTAAAAARLFPDATVTVQPGAAHFPWLDDPAFFTAAITSFLS